MKPAERVHVFCAVLVVLVGSIVRSDAQERARTKGVANPAQERFQAAQTFQLAGDYENAATQYHRAIAAALRQLGNLRISRHEVSDGSDLLAQAVEMEPSDTDARVDLAMAHFQLGQLDAANNEIEAALQQNPRDPRGLVFAGKIYFLQRNYTKAIERLQMALQLQHNFDIGYTLALANLALKQPLPAGVIFDEMLASTKPDAGMHVLIGIAYRENGYFEQAALHFTKAIELDPGKRNIHAALGITRYLQGAEHDAEAREEFLTELDRSPNDYTSLYYLGLIAIRGQKPADAKTWLTKAIATQPESREAYLSLGEASLSTRQWKEAVVALRKSLRLSLGKESSQETAHIHAVLGQALENLGHHDESLIEVAEAEKLESEARSSDQDAANGLGKSINLGDSAAELKRVLETAETTQGPLDTKEAAYARGLGNLLAEAFHNLGVIDARASRFAKAADEFVQAAKWNPAIDKLDRNWGIASFRAERYGQAIGPLGRELGRNQEDATLRQMLGLSYFMTDQFAKSAEAFRPIVNELPNNPGLLYAAGAALVRSGDVKTGRPLLLRMQELGANLPEAHVVLAQTYSDQALYDQALAELHRANELNPNLAEIHFAIGMVYFKQGNSDEAVEEFEEELAVNPQSISSKYQIAYIRVQQHRAQEAIPLLTDVLSEKPEYGDGHYQLGKALMEAGDTAGAIQHLERSVKLQPRQAYGYYQLSLAYRRAGQVREADTALHMFQQLKDKGTKASSVLESPN